MNSCTIGKAGFVGRSFALDWLAQSDGPMLNSDTPTRTANLQRNLSSTAEGAQDVVLHTVVCDVGRTSIALDAPSFRAGLHLVTMNHANHPITPEPQEFKRAGITGTIRLLEEAQAYFGHLPKAEEASVSRLRSENLAALSKLAKGPSAGVADFSTDCASARRSYGSYVGRAAEAFDSVYRGSKLKGHQGTVVQASRHLLFRASCVPRTRWSNSARTMRRLVSKRGTLNVINDPINDPIGAPKATELVAALIAQSPLQSKNYSELYFDLRGISHRAFGGEMSWRVHAQRVISSAPAAGAKPCFDAANVLPLLAEKSPPAALPAVKSRSATFELRNTSTFGPCWPDRQLLGRLVAELCG